MCQRITCKDCGKPGFVGCGRHVEQVLRDVAVATALGLAIVLSSVTVQGHRTLMSAPEYLRAQQAREVILKTPQNRGKALIVDALRIRPVGLYWGGLDEDAGHWINSCVASYYGVGSVRKSSVSDGSTSK